MFMFNCYQHISVGGIGGSNKGMKLCPTPLTGLDFLLLRLALRLLLRLLVRFLPRWNLHCIYGPWLRCNSILIQLLWMNVSWNPTHTDPTSLVLNLNGWKFRVRPNLRLCTRKARKCLGCQNMGSIYNHGPWLYICWSNCLTEDKPS